MRGMKGPVFKYPFFTIELDYQGDPIIVSGQPKTIRLSITNTYVPQANLSFNWYLPHGWTVTPSHRGVVTTIVGPFAKPVTLEFSLQADEIVESINRASLEITSAGRPTVMNIPITLLNGNYKSAICSL